MKILCKLLQKDWSWGLVIDDLIAAIPEHKFIKVLSNSKSNDFDIIFAQNVAALKNIDNKNLHKTVCRLGSVRQFDDKENRRELENVFAIVATNKKLYEIGKKFNENIFLLPNGLDLTKWSPVESPDTFTVGFAGNIKGFHGGDYKGFHLLKEACGEISVPLKTALYKDNQIPHKDMREKFYGKISCLVLPTLGEGCCNVIMESLACGVPVITTKGAGFHGELLENGVNCLFITRDVKDIAEKIKKLRDSHRLRETIAINGRKFAEEYHDIKDIASMYKEIFEECYLTMTGQKVKAEKEQSTVVKVRFMQNFLDNNLDFVKHGTVKEISLLRAKQLGELVEIL